MKIVAPDHIVDYCYRETKDMTYMYLNEKYGGEWSHIYKIRCSCNCDNFIVYKDAHPSVFAKCCQCGKILTIYDLRFYPAAIKLETEYPQEQIGDEAVNVYANYEYSDESLYEEDVSFDQNDVTWGKVFIKNENDLRIILDDETA